MKKIYTFKELSEKAKCFAIFEYGNGWLQTHEDDELDFENLWDDFISNDSPLYDEHGGYVGIDD